MKKTLLSLCVMLAAFVGMASAQNVLDNNLTGNKRFSVTVSTGEGGSIEIEGTGSVSDNSVATATILTGEDVTLVITPDSGYQLATLYVDGADVLADVSESTYVISSISKNMSVTATFEAIPTPSIEGDVNDDGTVNSSDVVAIYNHISEGADASGITVAKADVNTDGSVNSSDAVAVYNIISGSQE